ASCRGPFASRPTAHRAAIPRNRRSFTAGGRKRNAGSDRPGPVGAGWRPDPLPICPVRRCHRWRFPPCGGGERHRWRWRTRNPSSAGGRYGKRPERERTPGRPGGSSRRRRRRPAARARTPAPRHPRPKSSRSWVWSEPVWARRLDSTAGAAAGVTAGSAAGDPVVGRTGRSRVAPRTVVSAGGLAAGAGSPVVVVGGVGSTEGSDTGSEVPLGPAVPPSLLFWFWFWSSLLLFWFWFWSSLFWLPPGGTTTSGLQASAS